MYIEGWPTLTLTPSIIRIYLLYEIFLRGFHTVIESEVLLDGVHLVLAELAAALCHLVRRRREGSGRRERMCRRKKRDILCDWSF